MNDKGSSLPATALIADDEPLLLKALELELAREWPELTLSHRASNGKQAIELLLNKPVDIAFLDIKMPGASGIEVAQAVMEDLADLPTAKLPLFVFVTAYSDYAVDAFDLSAIDYVLKPVAQSRVAQTVTRLKARLQARRNDDSINALGEQLRTLLASVPVAPADQLQQIRASVGDKIHLVPVTDVVLFQASDKYVVVHTIQGQELLIRESLRDLLPQLDGSQFAQVHRSSIVNLNFVAAARRGENGKMTLDMKHSQQQPVVSRLYRHRFQAM